MKLNCIIIEDQRPAQEILEKYISEIGTLRLIGTYTDAITAMKALNNQTIDLIFLDIHLPKLSGIDFLKTLRQKPKVILTTAFPDYAIESYELDVEDYLLKPFSFQRFVKAVSKIKSEVSPDHDFKQPDQSIQEDIFIKSGHDHIRISTKDIIYLKSDTDYTEFHLTSQKYLSPERLKYWEEKLRDHNFVRIHKSYIINTSRLKKVAGSYVHFDNDVSLPIGRAYKEEFYLRVLK